ncbi:GDSL-type esterase/lipase family protein [uncultured Arcticibacterium sp.]|uniref:SGNH/GDSL hydrolase family protein n=1 Tax=uncultured Arcticibacterium sp. TaxID=2173042 RepID=UPI0030F4F668
MKYLKLLSLSLLFFMVTSFQSKTTKVIFFGDSITQAGVNKGGYITLMQEELKSKGLEDKYELIGAGIGGNKIYDLYLRMEDDVLSKNPDVVVLFVGVNDVWHKASHGTGTDADKFQKFYQAVIEKLQKQNIKVLLCTPAAIGEKTDHSNQQDGDLNEYSKIIRGLAEKNKCEVIDLRKDFLAYNLNNNSENKDRGILTTDRVHLNATGNRFVADKMWAAVIK